MDYPFAQIPLSSEASPMLGPTRYRDAERPVLFSLDASVPKDNLCRQLDTTLDLSFVHDRVKHCYEKAMRQRNLWTYPLFAEGKLWHRIRRFRLKRLWRVNSEALMTAVAQNLKRLLKWQGRGGRPASGLTSPLPRRAL